MSHVSIIEVQGVTVVRVRPKSDESAVNVVTELTDALTRIGGDGGEDLIVDLARTEVDDDLTQVLVKATESLKTSGHRLIVVSAHQEVRDALAPYSELNVSESLDAAAGDMSPAHARDDNPADHQRSQVPPLDARGY